MVVVVVVGRGGGEGGRGMQCTVRKMGFVPCRLGIIWRICGYGRPLFRLTGIDGVEREMNVLETVLYLIDFDLMKLLPSLYEDMRDGFLLPGILPGGAHCMMNQVGVWL